MGWKPHSSVIKSVPHFFAFMSYSIRRRIGHIRRRKCGKCHEYFLHSDTLLCGRAGIIVFLMVPLQTRCDWRHCTKELWHMPVKYGQLQYMEQYTLYLHVLHSSWSVWFSDTARNRNKTSRHSWQYLHHPPPTPTTTTAHTHTAGIITHCKSHHRTLQSFTTTYTHSLDYHHIYSTATQCCTRTHTCPHIHHIYIDYHYYHYNHHHTVQVAIRICMC